MLEKTFYEVYFLINWSHHISLTFIFHLTILECLLWLETNHHGIDVDKIPYLACSMSCCLKKQPMFPDEEISKAPVLALEAPVHPDQIPSLQSLRRGFRHPASYFTLNWLDWCWQSHSDDRLVMHISVNAALKRFLIEWTFRNGIRVLYTNLRTGGCAQSLWSLTVVS